MDKKIRFLFVLFVCLLSGCTSVDVPFQNDTEIAYSDADSIQDQSALTEYEQYALFEAEITCRLMNTNWWDPDETDRAADDMAAIFERSGLSDTDLESLRKEYADDEFFEPTVIKFMERLCPGYIDALSQYDGSDLGSTSSLTEKERYALFGADGTCYYLSVRWWDQDDVEQLMTDLESLPQKHGIPYEDVLLLKEKYKDDASFETMLIEEIKRLCPKSAAILVNQ